MQTENLPYRLVPVHTPPFIVAKAPMDHPREIAKTYADALRLQRYLQAEEEASQRASDARNGFTFRPQSVAQVKIWQEVPRGWWNEVVPLETAAPVEK